MLRTIRSRLYVLVALTVVPILAAATHAAFAAYRVRTQAELTANLELARSFANATRKLVADVAHDAASLGRSIATGKLSAVDTDRLLAQAVGDFEAVREFAWADPRGTIVRSSNPASIGVSLWDREYFRRVADGSDLAVSDLVKARVDGHPVIAVARGVRTPAGVLSGVIVAVIAPERLGVADLPVSREGDGAVALVDRAGRIVFRAPPLELSWDDRVVAPAQPIVQAALAGREETGTLQAESGDVRIGAAVPIADLGWAARASRSKAETLAGVRREILLLGFVAAVVAAAAFAASSYLGARTVGSLRRLERHASALGKGFAPGPLEGPKEIVRLGRSYEEMARSLITSRRRFEAVFDAAPAGIVVLDPNELRARWANGAFLETLDEPFRSSGIEGRRLDEFLPGAEETGLAAVFRSVAEGDLPHEEAEYRYDGFARGTTWWRWSVRPVVAESGDRELLLLTTDVTEQVLAREGVESDRRRLEAVLRTLPAGVFIADAGGQIVHVNDAAKRIWAGKAPLRRAGYREYRGRWAETGVALEPGDWAIQRALRTGESASGELIEIDRSDGTRGTILNNAAPIRDGEGRILGAVAALLDVTELRRAVRHRDELLQVVSHDLRTPLSTVVLTASTLGDVADGPEAAVRARVAGARLASAGRQMGRLIDDLLDLASLDEGRLSIVRATHAPADLLGEAAEQLADAARAKGLDLCLSAEPGLPDVDCDRDRILQVLGNVASNAVSATGTGAICLAAETRGTEVVFRVRDTGPGIPDDELPHLFDRYRRGASARWRGMGLGLAISRGLVEAHGGRIWAESTPGEGTTVSFTLPGVRPPEQREGADAEFASGAA
jgi:signal transduction histidine kinase